jgi:ATP-dependent helicase/nuclease subunit A
LLVTIDTHGLQEDESARIEALDTTRSFIVQAPAGSGKTELLIQRYLRLLATVDNPEEVLAITFTRKAAAEMQLRVLQALQAAGRDEEPQEAHEKVTAAAARSVLHKDRERGWDLIRNPRRMRIQTLDALNASLSRTLPLTSAGGAAASAIGADAQMRMLYRNAATLTLDQLLELGPMQAATELLLLHVDNNTNLYVSYLARMLATRDQWLPFIASGLVEPAQEQLLRQRFEKNLEGAVAAELACTRRAMPEVNQSELVELGGYAAAELVEAGKEENPTCALLGLARLPDARTEAIPAWQGLAELLLTQQGQWRRTVTKTQGFPARTEQKTRMLELLQSLAGEEDFRDHLQNVRLLPPVTYTDSQWSILLALFQLLPLAVTELKRLFSQKGVTDYIEVAFSAAQAVGTAEEPGDVALILDYQLRHLLVDEMQDTSSAQYRMLEALTGGWEEGDGRTLFCVGDPMQSIYRFRNAEVGQFLLARQSGLGNLSLNALTLRRNFRSGEKLVDWFNTVFPDVLAARDDPRQSAVAYTSAVAVPRLAGRGSCLVHPVFGGSVAGEAESACHVIKNTLQENPESDMAVLVRSRTYLPQLLSRLRNEGIAYCAIEIDRLTDLPEIIDLLALTRALAHPGDRLAWLAILRAPWAGLNWCDLHALVMGDARATVRELLNEDQRLALLSDYGRDAAVRVRDVLAAEFHTGRMDSLRIRVERIWLALGGPAILQNPHAVENVYRFLDVIEKLEITGTLADVAALEDALDIEHVSSVSNARLQIMTMHRAKGLQFDHVLLFGLGRVPGGQDRSVLSWFDIPGEHGRDEKVISPVGPRADIENDAVHRFIESIESIKNRHEIGRLLYVACTRARESLHLLGHVELTADGEDFRPARAHSLLSLLWPHVRQDFARVFAANGPIVNTQTAEQWMLPVLRRFVSPWKLPEPSLLPGASRADNGAVSQEAVEFYWVGSAARAAGTLVHRWLQLAADRRIDLGQESDAAIAGTSARWLAELGVGAQSHGIIVERVTRALKGIRSDKRGRWLLEGEGHAELGLTGILDGNLESVVLDRVRIDADGTHWIVDYKTSSHEGGSIDAFLQAESTRYRAQLEKYAALYRNFSRAPVRCALYFPLLQKFVEVPVS